MVKSGELFVKIGSRLQIALFFLFYWNVQPLVYSDFPVYLILPNVPTPRFLGLPPRPPLRPVYPGPKSIIIHYVLGLARSLL